MIREQISFVLQVKRTTVFFMWQLFLLQKDEQGTDGLVHTYLAQKIWVIVYRCPDMMQRAHQVGSYLSMTSFC